MDFGARLRGYCSDMTRTVAVGKISDDQRRVYDAVLEAHLRAMEAIKPGAVGKDVDAVARNYLRECGWDFGHSLGHGVGLDIHEEPRLSMRSDDVLEPGNVVTDEPGVYLPGRAGRRRNRRFGVGNQETDAGALRRQPKNSSYCKRRGIE